MARERAQTTTRIVKPLKLSRSPTKALLNACAWGTKCLRMALILGELFSLSYVCRSFLQSLPRLMAPRSSRVLGIHGLQALQDRQTLYAAPLKSHKRNIAAMHSAKTFKSNEFPLYLFGASIFHAHVFSARFWKIRAKMVMELHMVGCAVFSMHRADPSSPSRASNSHMKNISIESSPHARTGWQACKPRHGWQHCIHADY